MLYVEPKFASKTLSLTIERSVKINSNQNSPGKHQHLQGKGRYFKPCFDLKEQQKKTRNAVFQECDLEAVLRGKTLLGQYQVAHICSLRWGLSDFKCAWSGTLPRLLSPDMLLNF